MSYTLVFNAIAEQEYIIAYQWYEDKSSGLGDRFAVYIEDTLNNITENPHLYHKVKNTFREANIPIFPYSIVYKVISGKKIVYISAIHHHSRHPKNKFRK